MEENAQELETTQEEATEEAQTTEETTDWKAEARKWEARAKENKKAAEELEAIKQERMTESEKLQARAEAAEGELAALKAEAERTQAAQAIAAKSGVPMELLLFCADVDAMEAFAEKYQVENQAPPAAPRAQQSRIARGVPEAKEENRDVFARIAAEQLHMN